LGLFVGGLLFLGAVDLGLKVINNSGDAGEHKGWFLTVWNWTK